MKTIITAIIAFAAFATAYAAQPPVMTASTENSCHFQCIDEHQDDHGALLQCEQDCDEQNQSSIDGSPGTTQPSVMTAFVWTEHCDNECSGEGIDEEDYNACMSLCSDDNQSSIDGSPGTIQPPVMMARGSCKKQCSVDHRGHHGDLLQCNQDCDDNNQSSIDGSPGTAQPPVMIAQPTGNGGIFGGPSANAAHASCMASCKEETDGSDYHYCKNKCDESSQSSVEPTVMIAEGGDEVSCTAEGICDQAATRPPTMVAEGGCVINDQGEETCFGEDGTVVGAAPRQTMHASSIRIGDPQPVCTTDAWACFHGTDDESPMIRDVGIFGVFASGDCHHPLGCGY
ncbi:MAG: hypothetical protein ISN28_13065 [Ectothiorhodospiraceae bacterium AqS1]|nr:hypothetical protein [Ectothiorhodospiraceae bacterium AqS1]